MKSRLGEFQPTILVICSDQNDVDCLLLSGAFQQTAKRIKMICAVPQDTGPEHIQHISKLYSDSLVIEIKDRGKSEKYKKNTFDSGNPFLEKLKISGVRGTKNEWVNHDHN